jgi:hypothetical protein
MSTADPLSRLGWTDHHVGIDEVQGGLFCVSTVCAAAAWETRSTIAYL